ncbi:hypothetical protein Rsub_12129 [Raphidocelis subcapitata]|uniref:Glycosyl transferase family 1 domain-containing protein n=1 Tax=Raphidocelis subcapitata TaxID=307507 RepID=A0A2V0PJG3_9CHLO|nr:hypothetical protein Rsub_12129 [Raphidocelis subcapitata]|eukprot:GBF99162.1 hypothetical protein Rsub_12129 [Raphidocelis subcapitata]
MGRPRLAPSRSGRLVAGGRAGRSSLFGLLALLALACGCFALLALNPGGLLPATPGFAPPRRRGSHRHAADHTPEPLQYPIWWHAPFFSESGLGTEAITILDSLVSTGLMRESDIWITHSGDTPNTDVVKAFPKHIRRLLEGRKHPQEIADEWLELYAKYDLELPGADDPLARIRAMRDQRPAVAVCHMWFDCFRLPGEEEPSNMPGCPCPLGKNRTAYTVARTMFETASLPEHLAAHVAAMDEVWVPTEFNRDSFAAAGVDRSKIFLVPEAIDPEVWSPDAAAPLDLRSLGPVQATGPPADIGWVRDSGPAPPPPPSPSPPPPAQAPIPAEEGPLIGPIDPGEAGGGGGGGGGGGAATALRRLAQAAGDAPALLPGAAADEQAQGLTTEGATEARRRRRRMRRRRSAAMASLRGHHPQPAAARDPPPAPLPAEGAAAPRQQPQQQPSPEPGSNQQQQLHNNLRHHQSRPFVFLSVFKWELRKGWRELLRAFTAAFGPEDNVQLLVLARPFMGSGTDFAGLIRRWAAEELNATTPEALAALPRVYVSAQHVDEPTFVRVYRSVDALAIATHGEGWGRPQMEAMSMGLPVISTNWSGLTEFMSEAVAYPIRIDGLVTVQPDGPGFFKAFEGQRWAQPSVAHLTQLLRRVAENRDEARARGAAARAMVLRRFTPAVLAGIVDEHVRRIQGTVAARLRQEERAAAAAAGAVSRRAAGGWFRSSGGSSGGGGGRSSGDGGGGGGSGGGGSATSVEAVGAGGGPLISAATPTGEAQA